MAASCDPFVTPVGLRASPLRTVFAACGLVLGWVTADVTYGLLVEVSRLRLLTTYLLPAFAGAVLVCLWRLGREGRGRANLSPLAAGTTFLISAAGIDLYVTVRADPYLTLEGNPYIRALLDLSGHSYWFIYGLVGLTQALFVGAFVTAWWAFLRHRESIAESVRAAGPRNRAEFLKAATGGGGLTYRQWLCPIRPSEIPDPYFSVWPAALSISFGISLFRLWVAGEWLSLVPASPPLRGAVLFTGVGGTTLAYFAWLARAWRRGAAAPSQAGRVRKTASADVF